MTADEQFQTNLGTAIKFVNEQSGEYTLDNYGAAICATFIHRLLNDVTIRELDFDDLHFQSLQDRFDKICAEYQAKGFVTAYPDNAVEICRNAVAESILALVRLKPSLLPRPRRFPRHRQLVKAIFLLPKDMRRQRETQLLNQRDYSL